MQIQIGQLIDSDNDPKVLTNPPIRVITSERVCFNMIMAGQIGLFVVQPRRLIIFNKE